MQKEFMKSVEKVNPTDFLQKIDRFIRRTKNIPKIREKLIDENNL